MSNMEYKKVLVALDIENENIEKFLKKIMSMCELINPEETYIAYIN